MGKGIALKFLPDIHGHEQGSDIQSIDLVREFVDKDTILVHIIGGPPGGPGVDLKDPVGAEANLVLQKLQILGGQTGTGADDETPLSLVDVFELFQLMAGAAVLQVLPDREEMVSKVHDFLLRCAAVRRRYHRIFPVSR